ncbi:MAG: tRNA nucleotidyltransferase [Thiomicrorhabdus sp.]|nr:MAG: tRNA nucleotidyltransferase [Thiomicrorhabdus sp.]
MSLDVGLDLDVYLVGGAVRDGLLGIAVYDRDWVVVGATAEMMLDKGFQQVGKDFPVFLHPKTKEEYALARTERKAGQGYHGFEVFADPSVTLEADLIRRDLTINAIAQNSGGGVVDPYGGQKDLECRVLRHVSEAFSEDPLRVLRVARFAAKLKPFGFTLAEETRLLMADMVASGELAVLTPERVWQEVVKALNTETPSVFFEVLDSVGGVEVLFPELFALHNVTQPEIHHPEGDVWIHTMMVLDMATKLSTDPAVRLAALLHDLGKGVTPKELWPKHYGHEAAGVPLITELCQRYRVPKKWQQKAERVALWHGIVHQGLSKPENGLDQEMRRPALKAKTYLKVIKGCGALKDREGFESILVACEADSKGRTGFENISYPQKDFWLVVLDVASGVDNQAIIAKGYKGPEISAEIDRERLQLIADFVRDYGL